MEKQKARYETRVELNDSLIKGTVAKDGVVRISDTTKGLFVLIYPSGVITWRMRISFKGEKLTLTLGRFDEGYTTDMAREAVRQVKDYISTGKAITAPMMISREKLRELNPTGLPSKFTFENLYVEWLKSDDAKFFDSKYLGRVENQIKTHILPYLGETEATNIKSEMIKDVAEKLQEKGKVETSHRVVGLCSRIFKYGVSQKKIQKDPADSLKGTLVASKRKSMPSIKVSNEGRIGELIYKARNSKEPYANMLLMLAYTFVRPGELRMAEWEEFDLNKGLWSIPAERMRMSQPHIVPLSNQAIVILNELKKKKVSRYVFPLGSNPSSGRPADTNAILELLPKLGFNKEEMSAIGFRMLAKSIFESSNQFTSALIEKQFPHNAGNRTSSVSNNLEYIKERKAMVQWYADKLDSFEKGYAQKIGASRGIGSSAM